MDAETLRTMRVAAARVVAGHGLLAAYAYGSRVSGTPRPDSDLDVGYYLLPERSAAGLPLAEEMTLAAELGRALGVEVDFRGLDQAPLETRGRVLEDGVRIFSGDDVLRVGLERSTLSFYHDYKEAFQRMRQIRLDVKASGTAR